MSFAGAPWRAAISVHAQPRPGRTLLDLAASVVPYLGLLVATSFALRVSALLALALAPLTAGFQLRTFVVLHDCAHGSMFRARRANRAVGTVLGLLLYPPFATFAHTHAVHHATGRDRTVPRRPRARSAGGAPRHPPEAVG